MPRATTPPRAKSASTKYDNKTAKACYNKETNCNNMIISKRATKDR